MSSTVSSVTAPARSGTDRWPWRLYAQWAADNEETVPLKKIDTIELTILWVSIHCLCRFQHMVCMDHHTGLIASNKALSSLSTAISGYLIENPFPRILISSEPCMA